MLAITLAAASAKSLTFRKGGCLMDKRILVPIISPASAKAVLLFSQNRAATTKVDLSSAVVSKFPVKLGSAEKNHNKPCTSGWKMKVQKPTSPLNKQKSCSRSHCGGHSQTWTPIQPISIQGCFGICRWVTGNIARLSRMLFLLLMVSISPRQYGT